MKLLIDMNLSPRWVGRLAEAGFDACHWTSVGSVKAADKEIMAYAGERDWVVLTNDLDFSAILAVTHGEKPSVVQIRAGNLSPEAIGSQVIAALKQLQMEIASGALVTIEPSRTRIRILPLVQ